MLLINIVIFFKYKINKKITRDLFYDIHANYEFAISSTFLFFTKLSSTFELNTLISKNLNLWIFRIKNSTIVIQIVKDNSYRS